MKTFKGWIFLCGLALLLGLSQQAFCGGLIVVKKFLAPKNEPRAEELWQKIKTVITRQHDYDFASPEDIKNIVNNNYPAEKVEDCERLDCLLKFKDRLHIEYLLEGEIQERDDTYAVTLILYNLAADQSYQFKTPFLAGDAGNVYILNCLVQLFYSQPPPPSQSSAPPPVKAAPVVEVTTDKELLVKKEMLRHLEQERENLQVTLDSLQEKLTVLERLASEQEN